MLKESKNIDFYTTGKQPTEEDFLRISEWIRVNKEKESKRSSFPKRKSRMQKTKRERKNA